MTALGNAWVFSHTVSSRDYYQWLSIPCRSWGVRLTRRGVTERLSRLMVHLFIFFIQICHDLLVAQFETPKRRGGGSMVTTAHHACPGDRGAVSVRNQKEGKGMSQVRNWQRVFHRYNDTVSHPSPDWVVLRLPITATVLPPLSFWPASLKISSINPKLQL